MACGGAITATVLTAGAGMVGGIGGNPLSSVCLLYTSDAADE